MRGFTLIEMLVALSVAAILVAIAVPSFQFMIRQNTVATASNDFIAALNLARSEAIKRGNDVEICASANGSSCSGGNWEDGWIVFDSLDVAAGGQPAADDLVQVHEAIKGNSRLRGTARLTFDANGFAPASNATISASDSEGKNRMDIVVARSGRITGKDCGKESCS